MALVYDSDVGDASPDEGIDGAICDDSSSRPLNKHAFLACLSRQELARYARYEELYPGEACDLGQNPDKKAVCTSGRRLHTLTRSTWLVMDRKSDRWMTAQELLTSQGWPISAERVKAAGTSCIYIRCNNKYAPPRRTFRSMRNQVGNAIHINMIGSVTMMSILMFPGLGAVVRAQSAFEAKFRNRQTLKRRLSQT